MAALAAVNQAIGGPRRRRRGFTLIELLVVLAILATLLTIATPRYIQHVERAREATLRSSLKVMREAIDKFQGDQGRLPASLQELVDRNYLKAIPIDPVTDKRDTWVVLSSADLAAGTDTAGGSTADYASSGVLPGPGMRNAPGIADVRSGASGKGDDGSPFKDW